MQASSSSHKAYRASLRTLSIGQVRALQHQTGAQYADVKYIRDMAAIRSVFASAPNPDPASHLKSATRNVSCFAQSFNVVTKVSKLSNFTPRQVGTGINDMQ